MKIEHYKWQVKSVVHAYAWSVAKFGHAGASASITRGYAQPV